MRIGALLAALAALAFAAPATAKQREVAHLLLPLPAHARAGTVVTVKWTVVTSGQREASTPFGAVGMFVRLVGPSGASHAALAEQSRLPYTARVEVPAGGVTKIELGLQGWASTKSGTHYAPVLFPVR